MLEGVPDAALTDHVEAYARDLAARPPVAPAMMNRGLDRATQRSSEDAMEYEIESQATCPGSRDFREAMIA